MYEILYLVPPPFTEKDLPKILNQVEKLIEKFSGKIVSQENLGNKKLAYPIKQIRRGFYILAYFEMEPQKLKELNQKLKLFSEILRFLILKVQPAKKTSKIQLKEVKAKLAVEEKKSKTPTERLDLKTLDKKIDKLLEI